uniref:Uncharacterized protein n=1 Tax=Anguilla anguilla TaxID=7936 RepID=A0A0E9Q5Q9_ANGAN
MQIGVFFCIVLQARAPRISKAFETTGIENFT